MPISSVFTVFSPLQVPTISVASAFPVSANARFLQVPKPSVFTVFLLLAVPKPSVFAVFSRYNDVQGLVHFQNRASMPGT